MSTFKTHNRHKRIQHHGQLRLITDTCFLVTDRCLQDWSSEFQQEANASPLNTTGYKKTTQGAILELCWAEHISVEPSDHHHWRLAHLQPLIGRSPPHVNEDEWRSWPFLITDWRHILSPRGSVLILCECFVHFIQRIGSTNIFLLYKYEPWEWNWLEEGIEPPEENVVH